MTSPSRPPSRRPVLSAVLGGALWVPFAVLELLEPFGPDVRYDEGRGYDVVVDRLLFTLHALPGALALLLCAVGLSRLLGRFGVAARPPRALAAAAAVLGVVALLGVAAGFDPASTAGRIVGTLVLGAALLAAAQRVPSGWRLPLLALGVYDVLLLAVWPATFALGLLPAAGAAALLAAHGVAWAVLGALVPPGSGGHRGAGGRLPAGPRGRWPGRAGGRRPGGTSSSRRTPCRPVRRLPPPRPVTRERSAERREGVTWGAGRSAASGPPDAESGVPSWASTAPPGNRTGERAERGWVSWPRPAWAGSCTTSAS